ncbi:MAG: ring-cleaving dioxygenase [Gemmatimonas sp.]
MELTGIHHLTAISGSIRNNHRFYTQVVGMRLVKRSVNQDDVKAYHLFYADAAGSPGTDLTFFDWKMPAERRGTHSITETALRVGGEATLAYWKNRFTELGVKHGEIHTRDDRAALTFEDPEGQRLALIDDGGVHNESKPHVASPVPIEHQVHGLGPITMSVPELQHTHVVLTEVMMLRPVREYTREVGAAVTKAHQVHVYEMGAGGPNAELHVAVQPELAQSGSGAGGVHHVAFRTPNEAEYHAWAARLTEFGMPNSGEVDRYWFRSLYFREPNGILFEIATDGPGFSVDESADALGEKVVLPPFLEGRRDAIVGALQPLD